MKNNPLISGVDTLDVGICVGSYKLSDTEVNALRYAKEQAQQAGDCRDKSDNLVRLYGQELEVKPSGTSRHEIVLRNDDLTVSVCLDANGGEHYPEIKVHFPSAMLWRVGVQKAWDDTKNWIGQWAEITGNKVSRVDLCTDVESPLPKLSHDFREVNGKAITRNRYVSVTRHNSGLIESGYSFGSGSPVRCRVYDKELEIERQSHKEWFHDLWREAGWQGGPVTRVEFQMRRKFLKDRGINNMEQLIDRQSDIWQYLTYEWLLLCVPSNKDTNKSRWNTKPFWKLVQKGVALFGKFIECVKRVAQVIPKIDQLEKQALGVLASIGAAYRSVKEFQGYDYISKPEFMLNRFTKWLNGDEFEGKVQKRTIKYATLAVNG